MTLNRITSRRAKELVREGWDQRSEIYRPLGAAKDRTKHTDRDYRAWLAPIMKQVPRGGHALDLGCGCGLPTSKLLARRFDAVGVDISDVQIARARKLVPNGRFQRSDMTQLRYPPGSFEVIVSLYAIIHVPLKEQRPLFRRIFRWVTPGGHFLAILGSGRLKALEKGWLGSDSWMYWDHADANTYQRWLEEAGFIVEERKHIPEAGSGGHEMFRLKRPLEAHRARGK
ncbi:Methyltransferase type 11 [mine drainage metagenome]|uniref:Methyltransferase type 11 n=1 Tax=mine drainage metagenome TaxID=410659 RepID=T0ZYV9_9ZZZZ